MVRHCIRLDSFNKYEEMNVAVRVSCGVRALAGKVQTRGSKWFKSTPFSPESHLSCVSCHAGEEEVFFSFMASSLVTK